MSLTLTAPAPVIAPAEPLTEDQQDALLLLSATTEKIQKVKRTFRDQPGTNRAWSARGNID